MIVAAYLTPQQAAFAQGLARGLSQADSYRAAYDVKPQTKAKSIHESASRLARDINVQSRVRELLKEARISDIDTVGEAWDHLLKLINKAEDEGNMTACAALMRQRLQGLGAIANHHVTVKHESTLSDEELVRRIAGGDKEKAAILLSLLTPDSFDEVRH